MEFALLLVATVVAAVLLWLNLLATVAVRYDPTLDRIQTVVQAALVWLIPFFGAAFVLHLVFEHYPRAIPQHWIPWPFRNWIYGKSPRPNRNRDDNEMDMVSGRPRNRSTDEPHDVADGD